MFEPRALDELFPDWKAKQQAGEEGFADLPINQQVTKDRFYVLTKGSSIRMPTPPQMKNRGKNYVISLRLGERGLVVCVPSGNWGVEIHHCTIAGSWLGRLHFLLCYYQQLTEQQSVLTEGVACGSLHNCC